MAKFATGPGSSRRHVSPPFFAFLDFYWQTGCGHDALPKEVTGSDLSESVSRRCLILSMERTTLSRGPNGFAE